MSKAEVLFLNNKAMERLGVGDMLAAIADVEQVYRLNDSGDVIAPGKCVLRWGQTVEDENVLGRINAMPGVSCRMPDGAFYVMMNMTKLVGKRYGDKPIENSSDFALALLENAHVAIVPGNAFLAEGFCRLSYATGMENIEKGMDRLEAFLKELK